MNSNVSLKIAILIISCQGFSFFFSFISIFFTLIFLQALCKYNTASIMWLWHSWVGQKLVSVSYAFSWVLLLSFILSCCDVSFHFIIFYHYTTLLSLRSLLVFWWETLRGWIRKKWDVGRNWEEKGEEKLKSGYTMWGENLFSINEK